VKRTTPNAKQTRVLRILVFSYGAAAATTLIMFIAFSESPRWLWFSRLIDRAGESGLVFIAAAVGAVLSGMLASLLNRQHVLGWAVAAAIPPFAFPMALAFLPFRYSEKNIRQLGEAGDMPGLLHALNHTGSQYAARTETAKLAVRDDAAMATLIGALRDPSAKTRIRVISVLAETKSPKAISALHQALHDTDAEVAVAAAHNLKRLPTPDFFAAMTKWAGKGNPKLLRETGILILGEIGDPRAVAPLMEVLSGPDGCGMKAAAALGRLRAYEATETLARLFTAKRKREDRETVVQALCRIKDGRGIAVLQAALARRREKLRGYIIDQLGSERVKEALPDLFRCGSDRAPEIRRRAMKALGEIADPGAVPVLEQALGDPRYSVRNHAREALKKIAGTKA
jgi:HEAT repeat protein